MLRQTWSRFWGEFGRSLEPRDRDPTEYSELEEAEGQSLSLDMELVDSDRVVDW